MKIYIMTVAYRLNNDYNERESESISCWSKTFTTVHEATQAVRNDILSTVASSYDQSEMPDPDVERKAEEVFHAPVSDNCWTWDSPRRSAIWRMVEDDIAVTVHEDDNDTTMGCLGYRKDDNADAGVTDTDDDWPQEPRLVLSFKYISAGWDTNIDFSSPEEALDWVTSGCGSEENYRSRYQPLAIKVLLPGGSMRTVYDCQCNWEALEGELAYATGDDGSFADPKDLEERNNKYKEWYD